MRDRRRAPRRSAIWPARVAGAIVLICAVVVAILEPSPVGLVRSAVFDFFQRVVPRETVKASASPVVIVAIDGKSLAGLGRWPWPRVRLADLAKRLVGMGGRVVAFDMVFAEADRQSAKTGVGGDAAFASAIKGLPVVLGMGAGKAEAKDAVRPYPGQTVAIDGEGSLRYLPYVERVVRNVPEVEIQAAGLGESLLYHDGSGIVRCLPTVFRTSVAVVPSFFAEVLRVGLKADRLRIEGRVGGLQAVHVDGGPIIATDAYGNVWPHFGRFKNREILSAIDVLNGKVGASRVAGRYVLVGMTMPKVGKAYLSPLRQAIPDVEVHAQALESVLTDDLLSRPRYLPAIEVVCLIVSGLVAILGFTVCSGGLLLPALISEVAALGWLAWRLFVNHHLLFDVSLSIATVLILFAAIVVFRPSRGGRW